MERRLRTLLASSALMLVSSWANLALAQSAASLPPPPVMNTTDEAGVDLVSGTLSLSDAGIGIGQPSDGGLSWMFMGQGYRDPLSGFVTVSTGFKSDTTARVYTVSFGGGSAVFVKATGGATMDRKSGSGRSLTFSGGVYTFTGLDGSVAQFTENAPGAIARVTSIKRPNGEILDYTYNASNQILAVKNNVGYMIKYNYSNGILYKISAINLAIDYCDPAALSCATTENWMSATFSGPITAGGSLTITDNIGRASTYTYDSNSRIVSIKRPGMDAITINYWPTSTSASSNKVKSVVTPAGTWSYSYQYYGDAGSGAMIGSRTDPTGRVRQYALEYPKQQIRGAFWGDQFVQGGVYYAEFYDYNDDGDLSVARAGTGVVTKYEYLVPGGPRTKVIRSPSLTSPQSKVDGEAGYSFSGSLANCTNPVLCDKPIWTKDEAGAQTDYTYDSVHGGVTSILGPAPNPTVPTGPGNMRQLTTIQYLAGSSQYKTSSGLAHDPRAIHRPITVTTCEALNASGCADAPIKRKVVTYQYNTGNILPIKMFTTTTQAGDGSLARTTDYTYTIYGDVQSSTVPLSGGQSDFSRYDDARRLIGHADIQPASGQPAHATRFVYASPAQDIGAPIQVDEGTVADTSAGDAWAAFSVFSSTVSTYDNMGRKVREALKDRSGSVVGIVQYDFDAVGRPTYVAQRMNRGAFAALPSSAAIASTAGPSGPDRIVKFDYDGAGRSSAITRSYGVLNARAETTYTYAGLLQSRKDELGNVTSYTYDDYGRTQAVTYPSTPVYGSTYEGFTFDSANRLALLRRRDGQTLAFCYDALSRVTQSVLGNPANPCTATPYQSFSYDTYGRIIGSVRNGQSISSSFDALGRMTSHTQPAGTITYQYDIADRRTRMDLPGGFYLTYVYNAIGDLTSIKENGSSSLVDFGYDYTSALGKPASITRPNGAHTTYSYDYGSLRLTAIGHLFGGASQTFGYSSSVGDQTLARTSSQATFVNQTAATAQSYDANALNQLTLPSGALTYNARGDLSGTGSATYAYDDFDDKLTGATVAGTPAVLAYDPSDRPSQITRASVATKLLYDGADLVAEYDGNGVLLKRYVHGDTSDEPLVEYSYSGGVAKYWLHADALGSIVGRSNASGALVNVNTYDEYGRGGSSNQGRFQYTGQAYYSEVDLYYYKARMYSATLGRFLQPDPLGYGDGMNLYAYVDSDPVNANDPTGLCANTRDRCDPNLVDEILVTARRQAYGQDWLSQENLLNAAKFAVSLAPAGDLINCGVGAFVSSYRCSGGQWAGAVAFAAVDLAGGELIKLAGKGGGLALKAAAKCGCFEAGTPVLTPEGLRPIESLKVGDLVIAMNEETGERGAKAITAVLRPEPKPAFSVTLQSSAPGGTSATETFGVTSDHPWRSASNMWINTVDLRVHDKILTANGGTVEVIAVRETGRIAATYNLEVGDYHTYFVGRDEIWVHNACSKLLTASLARAGIVKQAGEHAHHIVAGKKDLADPARKVLDKFGIGIDDAVNGIPLPGNYHARLHTTEYFNAVNAALEKATSRSEAEAALQSIGKALQAGKWP